MDVKNTMDEFKASIKDELDLCDTKNTPWICANKRTPAGYAKIEKLVTDLVMQEKVTIGMAITQVENIFNPNSKFD